MRPFLFVLFHAETRCYNGIRTRMQESRKDWDWADDGFTRLASAVCSRWQGTSLKPCSHTVRRWTWTPEALTHSNVRQRTDARRRIVLWRALTRVSLRWRAVLNMQIICKYPKKMAVDV